SIGDPAVTVVARTLPSLRVKVMPTKVGSVPSAWIVYVVAVSARQVMLKYLRAGIGTLEPAVHGASTGAPGVVYERLSWKYCSILVLMASRVEVASWSLPRFT